MSSSAVSDFPTPESPTMSIPSPATSTRTPCTVSRGARKRRSVPMSWAENSEVSTSVRSTVTSNLRADSSSSGKTSCSCATITTGQPRLSSSPRLDRRDWELLPDSSVISALPMIWMRAASK